MLRCEAYSEERMKLWNAYENITGKRQEQLENEEEKLRALIGDTHQPNEEAEKDSAQYKLYLNLTKAVMEYITESMRKRRRSEERAESVKSLRGGAEHFASSPAAAQAV